jgi:Domain of unknown function (DUF4190)
MIQPPEPPMRPPGHPLMPATGTDAFRGDPSSQAPVPPNPVWIQPKEPRATTAMVLGIIAVAGGILCFLPALCGPVALVLGLKSLNAIKAQPYLAGRSEAMTGFILGIVATLLLVLSTLFVALMIWFAVEYPEEFRTLLEGY